jgi:hypothetical protein
MPDDEPTASVEWDKMMKSLLRAEQQEESE